MISFNSLDASLSEGINLLLLKPWISKVVESHQKRVGELIFIFCSDDKLLEINKKHLNHDYFTDIITFDLSHNIDIVRGEIYISTDRVNENAKMMGKTFENELYRVIIHGVLHLLGYKDKSEEEAVSMREQEDYCLSLLP